MSIALLQLPFPALLLFTMLSAGSVTWLLRRWYRPVALASAALAGSMAALLWLVDFATPVWIMPVINQALDLTAPRYETVTANACFLKHAFTDRRCARLVLTHVSFARRPLKVASTVPSSLSAMRQLPL